PRDPSVGVHEERRPDDAFAASGPLASHTPRFYDGVVFIREEREAEPVLFVERQLLHWRVGRDSDDVDAQSSEVLPGVTDRARLARAARRVGFRVEVDEDRATEEVLEPHRTSVLVEKRERGGPVARSKLVHMTTLR